MFSKLKYALIILLFALIAGYATWPVDSHPRLGVTNFDAVHLRCLDCATATPALLVDQASGTGGGVVAEYRVAATPVARFLRTGGMDLLNQPLSNIGNAGTDFGSGGQLTTAAGITITTGNLTLVSGVISQSVNIANFGLPSVITKPIIYTTLSGIVATIPDGQTWFVHKVFVQTTTNFDCTGDDCTLVIGDGNDADGFIAAADASLQAAFTEATGFEPGFYGIENGSGGAYTTDDGGPFVYLQSGAAETIDYVIGETSGTTHAGGAATIWVIYTRVR